MGKGNGLPGCTSASSSPNISDCNISFFFTVVIASVKFCYVLGLPSLKMSEGTPSQQGAAPCLSFHVSAHFQAEPFHSLTQDLFPHLSSRTYGLSALIFKLCPQAITLDNTCKVKHCTWGVGKAAAAGVKTPWIPLLRLGEKEMVKEATKRSHFLVLSQLPSLGISFSSGANCPKPSCRGALLCTAAAVSGDAARDYGDGALSRSQRAAMGQK